MASREFSSGAGSKRRRHRRNYNEPGHAHELTFSCFRGFQFLKAERTCEWLHDAIIAARKTHAFDLWAFVFMPEHVHLIVHPRQPVYEIELILQSIKEPVGRKVVDYLREYAPEWLPRIAVTKGDRTRYHFWQKGGGYDRNVIEPHTLLSMIDYIHMNPVRRGLVERAMDWQWSSAAYWQAGGSSPILLDPIPPEWLVAK